MTAEELAKVKGHILQIPVGDWMVQWNDHGKYIGMFITTTPKGAKLTIQYNRDTVIQYQGLRVHLNGTEYRYTGEDAAELMNYHHLLCDYHKVGEYLKKLKTEEETKKQQQLDARLRKIDELF